MPLVVITGFPASGKSKRCGDLVDYLRTSTNKNVVVISENNFVKDRNSTYCSVQDEKDVRGALKGELVRLISCEDVVILDALNYIKGFRYEIFCISKNCKTPQVTLQCIASDQQAWQWNLNRLKTQRYSRAVFDALLMRCEEPDSRNRWDSPLIPVQPDQETPSRRVLEALHHAPKPKPNQSTQNPMLAPTNYLFELDQQTQAVVKAVLAAQEGAVEGDQLWVPLSQKRYLLQRRQTRAQLSRLRRDFLTYIKSHPANSSSIPTLFVEYLNKAAT